MAGSCDGDDGDRMRGTTLALLELRPASEERPDVAVTERALTPDLGRAERQGRVVDFTALGQLAALTLEPGVSVPEDERVAVLREDALGQLNRALRVLRGLERDGVERVGRVPVEQAAQLLQDVAG